MVVPRGRDKDGALIAVPLKRLRSPQALLKVALLDSQQEVIVKQVTYSVIGWIAPSVGIGFK